MKKYIRKINAKLTINEINRKVKKEDIIFHDVNVHNNRAIDYGKIGRLTIEQANITLQYFDYRCAFSGEKFLNFDKATENKKMCNLSLEHIIALATGGNSLAYNCVPSILQYNLRKSVHHPLDWWTRQKNINGKEIFNPIRLLKLVNYMIKSLKALEEQEIEQYRKKIMVQNEVDKYINQNRKSLLSDVKTTYEIKNNKILLRQVPYNVKIPKLTDTKIEYEQIKLDLFILDCINLLETYNMPNKIIQYVRSEFQRLKQVNKVFKKIPEEENIQKELIEYLKRKNIQNIYTVARAINVKKIRKTKRSVKEYIEKKLKKIEKELEKNRIEKLNINIILDIYPRIIENKEEQEIIIEMIRNVKDIQSKDIKKYFLNIENRVKAEDTVFVRKILKVAKESIKYLNHKEMKRLKEKLVYNPIYNQKYGRRLKNGYESLYYELKRRGSKEPELSKEASKAYIYAKVGPDGFNSLQDNDKFSKEVKNRVLKNYKKGILELDFYLLEKKHNKTIKEADKELTKEMLLNVKTLLSNLDEKELKILKRRLEFNSKTCKKHGTRLINVYNKIYYALKKQGLKEPQLSIEASKAYIYCKIGKIGFYSIQCNDVRYKDKSIEKVITNYRKEFENIAYYLLDNKANIPRKQADEELTEFILNNTKEITSQLSEQEKKILQKQLLRNYDSPDYKTRRLIVVYNKIYYELKKSGIKEPKLSIEASKAYLYTKIAQVGFTNILQKERSTIKDNILKILEQYEEGLKKLDFYILSNTTEKNIEELDKKLTEKVLLHTKEIVKKLSQKEKDKLTEILLKNPKNKENKGIKLINAFNRIYCEMKKQGIKEPELTEEVSKAYIYAKISEFGFFSLLTNDKKYTNKNLKRLLYEYKEEIKNIEYYLLDNKYDKSVIEADKDLTDNILTNIKEITNKLDKNEIKVLKEKLLLNAKSNTKKGTRLINVYNRIYYAMKKQGLKEPQLSKEASKAYVFSKICKVGFNSILKGSNKKIYIQNILNNYQTKMNHINYYLLNNITEKRVEEDDKKLTEYVLKHTQSILSNLSKKEKEKLETKLLYNMKSNLKDGIKQRNAYNRIYCEMKKDGKKQSELIKEVCKAYLYAKIGPISFDSIVTYSKNRTNNNLRKIIRDYKEGMKKIDYYLALDNDNKPVKEADQELTEYVLQKAKDITRHLSLEKQKILKDKLSYNMQSHIKHGTRLKNAYNQIWYALKRKGITEPELSIEASKAYIYSKIISKHFSNIIQNNRQYIEENLEHIVNEYKEGLKNLDCYLHISNQDNNIHKENKKLINYILCNTKDILNQLTKEENEKIKQILLKRWNKNTCMTVFNKIYHEIKRKETNETQIIRKTCRAYLYGEIGPIGFNSIVNNEKQYGDKNLKKIVEIAEEQIHLLDYYLLYDKSKKIKDENIELSKKIYLEVNQDFPKLTQKQKDTLKRKLLKNTKDEIRLMNAYNKIYYTLKRLHKKEPELSRSANQIYAYIKLAQKGFHSLVNSKIYFKNEILENNIEKYLEQYRQLDFYLLDFYEDKNLKDADQIITTKVLQKSGILEQLNKTEERDINKLLVSNSNKNVKLVTVYNKLYFELSKRGLKGQKLERETSKAYIYAKIAKCGFTDIQDNTNRTREKIKIIIEKYHENIKNIKWYILNNKKPEHKKDDILTNSILENANDILKLLNQEEQKRLKEKLMHNTHKGAKLINVYNRIYCELVKKGFKEPDLTKEAAKAYIYAKIGPDGFCDIRDNTKNSEKMIQKIMSHYNERIDKIKYYLFDFLEDKNVYEADKLLINNILLQTQKYLGQLYKDTNFIERLNYNSQNKTKMIIVYHKIYFGLSKKGLKEPALTKETSKAFIYAKIGPEGFKQIQNNNKDSDECLANVVKYYKQGLEIIKRDYRNNQIDFTERILYKKQTIRRSISEEQKGHA